MSGYGIGVGSGDAVSAVVLDGTGGKPGCGDGVVFAPAGDCTYE